MPELPLVRAKRIAAEYGLNDEQADIICEEKAQADYFEAAVAEVTSNNVQLSKTDASARVVNWLLQDVKHIMGKQGIDANEIANFRLSPRRLASLVAMAAAGKINSKIARQTLEAVIAEDRDPEDIVREKGWSLISDPAQIAEAVRAVAEKEAATVAEAKAAEGKRRSTLSAFLVGKVLAATGGRADPVIVKQQVEALLG